MARLEVCQSCRKIFVCSHPGYALCKSCRQIKKTIVYTDGIEWGINRNRDNWQVYDDEPLPNQHIDLNYWNNLEDSMYRSEGNSGYTTAPPHNLTLPK